MEASSTDTAGVGTDEQNRTKILSLPFFAPTTLVMDVSKSHFRAPGPAGAKPQEQGDLAAAMPSTKPGHSQSWLQDQRVCQTGNLRKRTG